MNPKIISEDFIDIIIDTNRITEETDPESITYINERHSMRHIPIAEVDKCLIGEFTYKSLPALFTVESLTSLEESGVTAIQNNPNLALRGSGVLIGIIDTGIDYRHEAFIKSDGSTKILSLWDQGLNNDENTEQSVLYGTVYDQDEINTALKAENPLEIVPSTDEIGHGTMLAGIAVGNESITNDFRGVVPEAELVVVKLKQAKKIIKDIFCVSPTALCYQETDIMLGVTYVLSVAQRVRRPIVVLIALGSGQGSHDGRGALSASLSYYSERPNTAVVISAGNEGNSRRHYLGTISAETKFTEFELNVGPDEHGFSMEIWQSAPHLLTIEGTSPSGDKIEKISPARGVCRRISLVFERTIIYINNILTESESGDQLILVRFEYPTQGIWRFKLTNIEGLESNFNIWLPSGNLISNNTFFLNSDPNITLTSPANSVNPIVITAYNHTNDSIWLGSSRGYTRINVVKPDLAAPGVNLVCPTANNSYGTATGTGAAAAHAAGIVAMVMEISIVKGEYPLIRGNTIRQILIRGAKRDSNLIYPNNIWGYGIIDIFGYFESVR